MNQQQDELIRETCRRFLTEINRLSDAGQFRPMLIIGINSKGETDVHLPDVISEGAADHLMYNAKKVLAKKRRG